MAERKIERKIDRKKKEQESAEAISGLKKCSIIYNEYSIPNVDFREVLEILDVKITNLKSFCNNIGNCQLKGPLKTLLNFVADNLEFTREKLFLP